MDLKDMELLVASDYDEEEYFQFSDGVIRVLDSKLESLKSLMSYSFVYLFPIYKDNSLLKIFLQTVKSELIRERSCVYKNLSKIEQMEIDLQSYNQER